MNKFECIGRLTKDIELNTTTNGVSVAKSSIAVDRKYKDADNNKITDFFNLVFWRGLADTVKKYCHKGSKVYIAGELQNRSYDKEDGTKVYITEINVEDVEFLDNKSNCESDNNPKSDLTPVDDNSLPF